MSNHDKQMTQQRKLQINIHKKQRIEYLPDHIKQRVQHIDNDPQAIIDIKDDVILNEALLRETAERLHTGESDKFYHKIKEAYDKLTKAIRDNNEQQSQYYMTELSRIINDSVRYADARKELDDRISKSVQYKRELMKQAVDHGQIVSTAVLMSVLQDTARAITEVCAAYQFGEEIGTKIVARLAQIHSDALPEEPTAEILD